MPWQPSLLSHRHIEDDLSLGVWLMSLIFTNNEEKHLFSTVDSVAALSWPVKALTEPRNTTKFNLTCGYLNSFGEGGFNWQHTSKVSNRLTLRFYPPSDEGLEPSCWSRSFSRLFHKRLILGWVLPICGNISPKCVGSAAQLSVFLCASLYHSYPSPRRAPTYQLRSCP